MRKSGFFLSVLFTVFLVQPVAVLAEGAKKFPDSVAQLVAETKRSIKTVDLHQFKAALDAGEYDMIIDVRSEDEYVFGHVPNAMNIPRGVIEFKIWRYIGFPNNTDLNKKIYLYCKSGRRCALATKSLQDLGFSNVIAVDMTFKAWTDAGYPVDL